MKTKVDEWLVSDKEGPRAIGMIMIYALGMQSGWMVSSICDFLHCAPLDLSGGHT